MRKIILVIRDGWGYRESREQNAIAEAETPNTDRLMREYPNVLIKTSGEAVGLPEGYQGNSEVGHMTIGSGRIIYQEMVRINKGIEDGSFYKIPEFNEAIEHSRRNKGRLHLIGLFQTEGVHSHLNHLLALLELCRRKNFADVCVHAVTDGRDAPVTDGLKHVKTVLDKLREIGFGEIVTLSGRYYTMDRDRRWERTKQAYDCIVNGESSEEFDDVTNKLNECYAKKETDEFIKPRKLRGYGGIRDGDSVVFWNFRTDRTRQLTQAIVEPDFSGFPRTPPRVFYVAMTQFYSPMNAKVAFKEHRIENLLGEVIAKKGLAQLRVSETEKYAHVTFFFNCQIEKPFAGEDRIMVNSPKVATYDLKPEMSANEVAERLVSEIQTGKYDFIAVNFVNCDMVGHTGIPEAIRKAVATVDGCVGKVVEAGLAKDYTLLVFADHGNAEDQTPEWRTSHTTNPVPLILVSKDKKLNKAKLKGGLGLSSIAPTVLKLMGIEKPKEMTGESLIA